MDLTLTLWLTALFGALTVLSGWRGALAPDPRRGVRMVPWRFLMVLSAGLSSLLLVHVVALLTGAPS